MNAAALHSSQSVKAVDGCEAGLCCQRFRLFLVLHCGGGRGFVADLAPFNLRHV